MQGVEEKDRKKNPPDFNDEEMQRHLVDAHGYPERIEPELPPLTNKELSNKVAELEAALEEERAARGVVVQAVEGWQTTFTEIVTRLDALEGGGRRKKHE
jgi:capsular polysaccharide biosynthesis protein